MADKPMTEFEVLQVANGFLVIPRRGRGDYPIGGYEHMHVFATADELAEWLRKAYTPVPPPIVPPGWKVIPA